VPFTEPSVVKSRGSRIRTHFECIQLGHNMAIKSGSRAPALSFTPVHPAHNNRRTNPSSEVRRWHRTGMHLIRYRGAINHFTVNFHGRARARVGSAVRCAGCAMCGLSPTNCTRLDGGAFTRSHRVFGMRFAPNAV
jgi:hypothetical protein